MTEQCIWKKLYRDPKSTSGLDLRRRRMPCGECFGYKVGKFVLNRRGTFEMCGDYLEDVISLKGTK